MTALANPYHARGYHSGKTSPMKVAQVAPLAESVPPHLYGGTERVIHWLTEELIQQGHQVTLFGTGDSQTSAKLIPVWPRALRLGRPRSDPIVAAASALEVLSLHATEFDIIHSHGNWCYLPLLTRLGVPFVTTLHGRLDIFRLPQLIGMFPQAPFVSISNGQRSPVPNANWAATIYHGFPPDWLHPNFERGPYLAFLGRLSPEKGPEPAIRIARAANMRLRIAAKIPRGERGYFAERLQPMIDGNQTRLVGEVDDSSKQQFLGGAAALLFPIDWPEPFGLVMIEAMACGTPVIAFRRGSVPEVIEHGVSGFIVENEAEAIQAVRRLPELDRRKVRASFERRFTSSEMGGKYVSCYRKILADVRGDHTTGTSVTVEQVGALMRPQIGYTSPPPGTALPIGERNTNEHYVTRVVNDELDAIGGRANTREVAKGPPPGGYAGGLRKDR
jgi:glycosyltransferase involved in cell wall biosynthesis